MKHFISSVGWMMML